MKEEFDYEAYYKKYWSEDFEHRYQEKYYEKTYDLIKKELTVSKHSKIIDIGGGNGDFLNYMRYKFATILDISDSGLKLAKKRGYTTIKANILQRYPIKAESFDVAYCFEVLEHLDKSNIALCEIYHILKKDGILFLSIPNFKPDGIQHKKRWQYIELKDDLKKCGFSIIWFKKIPRFNMPYKEIILTKNNIIVKTILVVGHIIFFKQLRILLSNIFPNMFVASYIVKCKKA